MKVLFHHRQRFGGVTLSVHTDDADQFSLSISGNATTGWSTANLNRHYDHAGNESWRVFHPVRYVGPSDRVRALIAAFPLDLCWMPLLDALAEEFPEFEAPVRAFTAAREGYARDRSPPAGD